MTPTAKVPAAIAGIQMNYAQLALAAGLLAVLLIAGYIGVMLLRRWTRLDPDDRTATPFTLEQLRTMHREGQLSDEEFNRARERMLAKFGADTSAGADGSGKTPAR